MSKMKEEFDKSTIPSNNEGANVTYHSGDWHQQRVALMLNPVARPTLDDFKQKFMQPDKEVDEERAYLEYRMALEADRAKLLGETTGAAKDEKKKDRGKKREHHKSRDRHRHRHHRDRSKSRSRSRSRRRSKSRDKKRRHRHSSSSSRSRSRSRDRHKEKPSSKTNQAL